MMPSIVRKGKARWKRGPVTASGKALGIKDAAKRRVVKEGFPRWSKLQTLEEVDDYFSRDTLTCLMCGHEHKTLTTHLKWCHSMTNQDYKERFGLPYNRGLYGVGTKQIFRELAKANLATNHNVFEKGVRQNAKGRKRPMQPYELDRMKDQTLIKGEAALEFSRKALAKRWRKE